MRTSREIKPNTGEKKKSLPRRDDACSSKRCCDGSVLVFKAHTHRNMTQKNTISSIVKIQTHNNQEPTHNASTRKLLKTSPVNKQTNKPEPLHPSESTTTTAPAAWIPAGQHQLP
ncbi:unnamed protein product [Ectocarpus fasciculatus]